MKIASVNHYNETKKRFEILLTNFDFYDGIDLISNIICKEYPDTVNKKIEGIYYRQIEMKDDNCIYFLEWHEDIGNYIYSQNEKDNYKLKLKIKRVIEIMNLEFHDL